MTVVPSGLAAVGRYALPIRISARYVFQIIPDQECEFSTALLFLTMGSVEAALRCTFPMGRDQELFRI